MYEGKLFSLKLGLGMMGFQGQSLSHHSVMVSHGHSPMLYSPMKSLAPYQVWLEISTQNAVIVLNSGTLLDFFLVSQGLANKELWFN